ncbi:MAG: FecR domain-containing protein [Bacteroidales bacterium]|nr:FecR domain-containing protein [Bacteroidales bacterium]
MKQDVFPGWDSITGINLSEKELEHDFRAVLSRAREMETSNEHIPVLFRRYRRLLVGFAAAFAISVIASIGILVNHSSKTSDPAIAENVEYSASKGEIKEVTLPDKSKVVLNSGSVLICPKEFGGTRSVYLMGEAVFDVVANDTHPFVVTTAEMQLRVHGTRFNVRAYFDDPDVQATLYHGAVEVWPMGRTDRSIELKPGNTLTYTKSSGAMVVSLNNAFESTSWEKGDICFRSETIQGVIRIIERHFNVNVYLTTAKYNDAVITASFIHGETLDALLNALMAVIPGMKYSIDGDKVYLK